MVKKIKGKVQETQERLKIFFIVVASVVIASVVFVLVNYLYMDISYKDKFLLNTKIAGIDFSGKSKKEAEEILISKMQEWNETPLIFYIKDKEWKISKTDLAIDFNLESTIEKSYKKGREGNFLSESINRLSRLIQHEENDIDYSITEESLKTVKDKISGEVEVQAINTSLIVENGDIKETKESVGKKIREKDFTENVRNEVNDLSSERINLTYYYIFPNSDKDALENIKKEAEEMISNSLTLFYESKKWLIDSPLISSWITIESLDNNNQNGDLKYKSVLEYVGRIWDKDKIVRFVNNSNNISLDKDKVDIYLNDIANQIDVKPKNVALSFIDNKLAVSQNSQKGFELDKDNARFLILAALKDRTNRINLSVKESIAKVREDNLGELGIKELIGQGKSDFTGSTPARINNVKVGASKFDSILIAPDEEFSFVKYLGDVDAAAGFLPELVIKPGKLVKEYGGGLCQVATTSFRAALYAGLTITERKNHSYVVSYYFWPFSGPGTDATIYGPHPDLRFKNDTGHYILIQTYTEGKRLFFDYYGTKGDRSSTIDGPYTLSSNPDGSATTVFYRNVFENGILKKRDTFNSYYKPAAEFKREE